MRIHHKYIKIERETKRDRTPLLITGQTSKQMRPGTWKRTKNSQISEIEKWKICNWKKNSGRRKMKLQRVGDYLLGEKLGEGSFAKVRVGLHVMSREKVSFF